MVLLALVQILLICVFHFKSFVIVTPRYLILYPHFRELQPVLLVIQAWKTMVDHVFVIIAPLYLMVVKDQSRVLKT